VRCNLTLLFSMAQAKACADAGAVLISPFVGRITDWHAKKENRTYQPEEDPGVQSVRRIFEHYKAHGIETIVMGASFPQHRPDRGARGLRPADHLARTSSEARRRRGGAAAPADPRSEAGGSRGAIDEGDFRWEMNEDAMATEKLAEGIRNFHADAQSSGASSGRGSPPDLGKGDLFGARST
jgi:transaldolase